MTLWAAAVTLLPASLPGRYGSGLSPPCDWGEVTGEEEGVKSISKEVRIVEEERRRRWWCWTQVDGTNDHHGLLCGHSGTKRFVHYYSM